MKSFKQFLDADLNEAHKIGTKVEIVKGSAKGTIGHIGEIRHGAYKGAPKTYTVYHGEHGATQVPKEHIRAVKEEVEPLDELKTSTVSSYAEKAAKDVKELKPFIKKGQSSIAQRIIDRRKKGLAMAGKRMGEEVELEEAVDENFADGKNPQDKGDSKRHGVPTKAPVSTLRKVAKEGGRKGQLAHWMANMKAGKAKKNAELDEAKGELTYKPEHAKWGVVPKSSKEFVKFFPKDKEVDARSHAEKTGGTLKKIDQMGRAIREEVEIDEAMDFKKEAAKHMKDMHDKNATPANKAYAQKMLQRALEASKMKDKVAATKHYMGEEVEIDEADNLALRGLHTANPQSIPNYMRSTEKGKKSLADKNKSILKDLIKRQLGKHPKANLPEEVDLEEKTLTPAELKKREEIAKAMERKSPHMDKSRKMAIATAVAKRVAEQYDETE